MHAVYRSPKRTFFISLEVQNKMLNITTDFKKSSNIFSKILKAFSGSISFSPDFTGHTGITKCSGSAPPVFGVRKINICGYLKKILSWLLEPQQVI